MSLCTRLPGARWGRDPLPQTRPWDGCAGRYLCGCDCVEEEGERRAFAVDEATGRPRSCLRGHGGAGWPHGMSLWTVSLRSLAWRDERRIGRRR